MGEKKFLEKSHFLVPKIGFTQILNDLVHIWQFLKFGPFLELFKIFHFFWNFSVFWSEKWAKKNFSRKVIF